MTTPDHEPPPMVPSPRDRVVQVAGCFKLPEYPDEVCRAADAVRLVEHAYRDGWNAAIVAQAPKHLLSLLCEARPQCEYNQEHNGLVCEMDTDALCCRIRAAIVAQAPKEQTNEL